MRKLLAITILALALAAVAGCSGGDDEEAAPSAAAKEAVGGATVEAAREPAAVQGDESVAGAVVSSNLPGLGNRVIQTASLRMSVPRDRFDEAVEEARIAAAGLGGFVVSSSASQGRGNRLVRGTLVVRVPAQSYARAMSSLSDLGRIESREESGQDVSQEFVDLEARARHLEAVETQLLELLDRANTVAAALAVQSQLSQIQLELEQVRGRLRFLDDQVSFATISLAIHERGVAVVPKDDNGWSIVEAWRTAGNGFLAVVGGIFIALATAAPILVLLAAALLVGRIVLRRRAGPAQA